MIGCRPLEDAEVARLLQGGFIGKYALRNRAFFALGVSTGYRCQELLQLRVRHVVYRTRVSDYSYLPAPLRKRSPRSTPEALNNRVFPFAQRALQLWLDERRGDRPDWMFDELLFVSREQNTRNHFHPNRDPAQLTPQQANNFLRAAFTLCGIQGKVGTHSMRKTFAKKAYYDAMEKFRAGTIQIEPLRVVQRLLGHKDVGVTLRYLSSFIGHDLDQSAFEF